MAASSSICAHTPARRPTPASEGLPSRGTQAFRQELHLRAIFFVNRSCNPLKKRAAGAIIELSPGRVPATPGQRRKNKDERTKTKERRRKNEDERTKTTNGKPAGWTGPSRDGIERRGRKAKGSKAAPPYREDSAAMTAKPPHRLRYREHSFRLGESHAETTQPTRHIRGQQP